jgi:hypothetical protein
MKDITIGRFRNYNAPGTHWPTQSPAYTSAPTAVSKNPTVAATYEGHLLSFPIAQTQAQMPAADHETLLRRLLGLEISMQWMIENQHKLLEKMERIMSSQANAEKRTEKRMVSLESSVLKFSETFNDWKDIAGHEVDIDSCNECDCEEDRYTGATVDDRDLP